jgi:signal peptidase I
VSPRARRFFGCVLPLAFLLGGCVTVLMVGYAGQVVVNLDEVRDPAMSPLLKPGVTVLVNNTAFWYEEPYRPAIVTVRSPRGRLIRRIVGLPGETIAIQNNQVVADGKVVLTYSVDPPFADMAPLTLGPDEYFVLAQSPDYQDSRSWGPLPRDEVFGVATFYRSAETNGWQVVVTPVPSPTPRR